MTYATIGGKKYPVEIKNGVRYINGLTVDAFFKTLSPKELAHAAIVGQKFIESNGDKSPQKMFNELHQSDNN